MHTTKILSIEYIILVIYLSRSFDSPFLECFCLVLDRSLDSFCIHWVGRWRSTVADWAAGSSFYTLLSSESYFTTTTELTPWCGHVAGQGPLLNGNGATGQRGEDSQAPREHVCLSRWQQSRSDIPRLIRQRSPKIVWPWKNHVRRYCLYMAYAVSTLGEKVKRV